MAKDNYHDKGYKELLSKKRNFIKFLRHFVKKECVNRVDESSLRLCDKGFVDPLFKELESDLIYSAKIADKSVYFYILTELQSSVDFTMPHRMLKYIWAILDREFNNTPENERKRADFRLPLVVPILFYNGENKWHVTRNYKDYLHDGDLHEGVINFQYTLVDINLLEREYLLKNHDAICAAIAVDKVRGKGSEQLSNILSEIINSKSRFVTEEFDDLLTWLKHTLEHRVSSDEDVKNIINLIEEGDVAKMRTGIDILFDNAESEGIVRAALRLIAKGKSLQEATDLLDLSDEQRNDVESRAGLKTQLV